MESQVISTHIYLSRDSFIDASAKPAMRVMKESSLDFIFDPDMQVSEIALILILSFSTNVLSDSGTCRCEQFPSIEVLFLF